MSKDLQTLNSQNKLRVFLYGDRFDAYIDVGIKLMDML